MSGPITAGPEPAAEPEAAEPTTAATTSPGGGRPARRPPGWRRAPSWASAPATVLIVGWAAQVAVRLWYASGRTAPMVYPDEAGYLVAARWLAGGPGGDLSGYTFYRAGYSLLLVPAQLLSQDPETVYRATIAVNAAAGAALFPLGAALLSRCGVDRLHAYPIAWALALLPATTLFGEGALADAVLPTVVLGWLLALHRFLGTGGRAAGVLAALAAAYAYAAHARGTVVIAVHVLALAGYLTGRLIPHPDRRGGVTSLAVTATGAIAAGVLNASVRAELYPAGATDLGAVLRDRLTSLDGQLWAVSGAVGQWWAVLCGTWGLAGLGLCATLSLLRRRSAAGADRVMAAVLVAATAGIAYASSAALPDEHRVGNHAYGRYLSCAALVFALAGAAALLRRRRIGRHVLATIAMIGLTALWVRLYGGDRLAPGQARFIGFDLPEIGLLGGSYTRLRPAVTCVTATVLLLGWWGLRRLGPVKLFAGLLLLNLGATRLLGFLLAHPYAPVHPLGPEVSAGRVVLDRRVPTVSRTLEPPVSRTLELLPAQLAFGVSWTEVERFDARRGGGRHLAGVCAAVVPMPADRVAARSWPGHPAGWRFRAVGGSVRAAVGRPVWVVWHDPGCPAGR